MFRKAVPKAPMSLLLSLPGNKLEPKSAVPEAFNAPATCRPAPTDDEALEIKPPVRVERPVRLEAPPTARVAEFNALTGDEALLIKPPTKVAVGLTAKVVTVEVATPLRKAELETFKLAVAAKLVVVSRFAHKRVPETFRLPWLSMLPAVNNPPTDEEALEMNPPVRVERPVRVEAPPTAR